MHCTWFDLITAWESFTVFPTLCLAVIMALVSPAFLTVKCNEMDFSFPFPSLFLSQYSSLMLSYSWQHPRKLRQKQWIGPIFLCLTISKLAKPRCLQKLICSFGWHHVSGKFLIRRLHMAATHSTQGCL